MALSATQTEEKILLTIAGYVLLGYTNSPNQRGPFFFG